MCACICCNAHSSTRLKCDPSMMMLVMVVVLQFRLSVWAADAQSARVRVCLSRLRQSAACNGIGIVPMCVCVCVSVWLPAAYCWLCNNWKSLRVSGLVCLCSYVFILRVVDDSFASKCDWVRLAMPHGFLDADDDWTHTAIGRRRMSGWRCSNWLWFVGKIHKMKS